MIANMSFIISANFCSGTKYRMAGLIPNKKSPNFKKKIVRSARGFKRGICEGGWKHMHVRDKKKKRKRKSLKVKSPDRQKSVSMKSVDYRPCYQTENRDFKAFKRTG